MAFRNEYVPPLEQETAEFFRKAQKKLKVAAKARSKWTVDREREIVLHYMGAGRDGSGHRLWSYLDHRGRCAFSTELLSQAEISPEELAISYRLNGFWEGDQYWTPNAESLACIKEALQEFKDWGMASDYKRCRMTLVDGRTGKEI